MTDHYEKIRQALAKRPTPGPWELRDGRTDTVENAQGFPVCTVAEEAADALEAAREEVATLRKAIARAWNEGFDFAMKACGWQEGEDPATEGLYVVRDSKGNVEVGMWYAKTMTQSAEWTREFRDVDRDDIVAWVAIPDWRTARNAYKLADAMLRAREVNE